MKTMLFEESKDIQVPVMRNGQPTKRMKNARVYEMVEKEVLPIEIKGHIAYYRRDKKESQYGRYLTLYKEDGTCLKGEFMYGRTGQTVHIDPIEIDKDSLKLIEVSYGYDGPCGRGSVATLVKILW